MKKIFWGLLLTGFRLNFLSLEYVTPTFGMVLLILGFSELSVVNRHFRWGYKLSVIYAVSFMLSVLHRAMVWELLPWITVCLFIVSGVLKLAILYVLYCGVRKVQKKASVESPKAAPLIAVMVWESLILVCGTTLYLSELASISLPFGLLVLIAYGFTYWRLWKLTVQIKNLIGNVTAAPARSCGRKLVCGYLLFLFAGMLLVLRFASSYPMRWEARDEGEQSGKEDIRKQLFDLGFPREILDDLTAEELGLLQGAVRVDVKKNPSNSVDATESPMLTTIAVRTVSPENPADIYRVIIHYFVWKESPGMRYTECLEILPAWRSNRSPLWPDYDVIPSGRLLYDADGSVYKAPFYEGDGVGGNGLTYMVQSPLYAAFSLPAEGENIRGYVLYRAIDFGNGNEPFNTQVSYTHRLSWLLYPATSALDLCRQNSYYQSRECRTVWNISTIQ